MLKTFMIALCGSVFSVCRGPMPRCTEFCKWAAVLIGRGMSACLGGRMICGNVSAYLGRRIKLADYIGWLGVNFDPSIGWCDLQWIRDSWKGAMVIKGYSGSPRRSRRRTFRY